MQTIISAALPFNGDRQRAIEGRFLCPRDAGAKSSRIGGQASALEARAERKENAAKADLTADAKSFLRDCFGDGSDALSPVSWCRSVAKSVHRTSRASHLKAIAYAHAFYLQLENLPGRELILRDLEQAIGRKRSARTLDIHIVVENFVAYDMGTPDERAAARRLYSRDARAIEYLRKKRIRPSQVEVLARAKDEGLDRWSRRAAVPRPKQKGPSAPSLSPQQEARERSLRHVLLHIVRQADGTEVERKRIAVTGVLADEVKGALERFRKIEAEKS